MDLFYQIFLLVFGLILLIKGADFFVDGSAGLALMFGVSPLFIGLTLVAFGTSAPEAAVSIQASIKDANSISLGNIIGSNIANIGLVLGLTAIFRPVIVPKSTLTWEIPFVIISTVALALMMFNPFGSEVDRYILDRTEGLLLLIIFLVFLGYTINMAKKDRQYSESNSNNAVNINGKNSIKFILMSIGGLAAIAYGGSLVVDSSIQIASKLGVSEKFIAVTIIAVGTSLPELVTSVVAALKKEAEIAIGNIIGSCIFNILLVLGFSASIHNMDVDPGFRFDLGISFLLLVLTFVFALKFTKFKNEAENSINRIKGLILLIIYFLYIAFLIYWL